MHLTSVGTARSGLTRPIVPPQELNVTRQKLELEQAAARKLRTERDAAAKQRDELSLHCDKQSADAASLEEVRSLLCCANTRTM